MNPVVEGESMGKEDRKRRVLRVLADGHALPPIVIFRNAKLQGADFERRSVNNYLPELHDDGLVRKVDADALDDGRLVDVPLAEEGYFVITEAGLEHLADAPGRGEE